MTFLQRSLNVLKDVPFLGKSIEQCREKYGNLFSDYAETHLELLYKYFGQDKKKYIQAHEHFIELTFETLKMQSRFARDGTISSFSPEEKYQKIYNNEELMKKRYLWGLYLAHVFWANHFEQIIFYKKEFLPLLPRLPRSGTLVDIGCGPGTHTILAHQAQDELEIVACDVSPFSVEMTSRMFAVSGGKAERLDVRQCDFTELAHNKCFDAAVFSEVLEHLDNPPQGLTCLRRMIKDTAPVFFSTATNSAFYDHTITFDDINQIKEMLHSHGFAIAIDAQCPVYGNSGGPQGAEVIDYFAIIEGA